MKKNVILFPLHVYILMCYDWKLDFIIHLSLSFFCSGEGGWRGSVRLSTIAGVKGTAEGGDTIKSMKEKKFQRGQRGGTSEEKSGMSFWWSSAPIKPSIDICTDALGPVGLENFNNQMF